MMRIGRLFLTGLFTVAVGLTGCAKIAAPKAVTAPVQPGRPTATLAQTREPAKPTATPEAAKASLSGKLSLAGSTTVQPLAEILGEAFMETHPDVVIEVQGGGTSVGVTAAGEGTTDIGMASRALKQSEIETYPDLEVVTIAVDGIAIIVNPTLNLTNLTREQVRGIYAGEITNYKEVGGPDAPITVVSREEGSGTRTAFQELIMTYTDATGEKKEKDITASALLQQSNGQVRALVATTPNTIGYVSLGFVDSSVHAVAIDGVTASVENVKSGNYPISRPLNLLTKGTPTELTQGFIDFVLSDVGQQIVAKDYVSVR